MVNVLHGKVLKKEQFFILSFFLIFINDLSDNLVSNPKLFVDDASLFSVVQKDKQKGVSVENDF